MEKEFITLVVAPNALPKLLLALYNEGIKKVTVALEDNDLEFGISKEDLEIKEFVIQDNIGNPIQISSTTIEITKKPKRGRPRKNK